MSNSGKRDQFLSYGRVLLCHLPSLSHRSTVSISMAASNSVATVPSTAYDFSSSGFSAISVKQEPTASTLLYHFIPPTFSSPSTLWWSITFHTAELKLASTPVGRL